MRVASSRGLGLNRVPCVTIYREGITHKETDDLCPQDNDVKLVEGNVEERHEAIKTLEEYTFHH